MEGGLREWSGTLGVLGVIGFCFALRKQSRGPLAAALLFLGILFPALGFFNVYPFVFSYVADHFAYLATQLRFSTPVWRSRLPAGCLAPAGASQPPIYSR
jgi:hypothetical protein